MDFQGLLLFVVDRDETVFVEVEDSRFLEIQFDALLSEISISKRAFLVEESLGSRRRQEHLHRSYLWL